MPEKSLNPTKVSRSLTLGLGATEILYILGLVSLATGVSLAFSFEWALIISGAVLIGSAFFNAAQK